MNCPNCNTPNRDGAKRCRNCGNVLPQPAAPQYAPQPPQPLPPPYSQQQQPPPPYQPPPAPQPVPPKAAQRGGRALPWSAIGVGCLLLFIGFLFGIAGLLLVQAVGPNLSGATATPTATATPAAGSTTPAAAAPTAIPTPAHPDKGLKAPTFTLKDSAGADKDLNGLINGKFAVLVFWSTGVPMTDTLPALKNFVDTNRGVVIAVNSDDVAAKVNKFVIDNGLSKFTMLLDGEQKVKEQYKITEVPTFILINKDGMITERLGAATKRDVLDQKLGDLK